MTLEEAKVELEKFVSLKTTMRPAFVQPLLDAVEVVRCKDCKNYGTDENRLNCIVFCCTMPKNGFCSMGERKDGKRMDCNR